MSEELVIPEQKKLRLLTSDKEEFIVDESTSVLSKTIKNMVEDDCASSVIPIPNVDSRTMVKILDYCIKHASVKEGDESKKAELKAFDEEYVKVLDQESLYYLLLAANFLDIPGLLDILCEKTASMIKGKSVEQIRADFGIVSDFTPEEEEAIRRENAWAFEN